MYVLLHFPKKDAMRLESGMSWIQLNSSPRWVNICMTHEYLIPELSLIYFKHTFHYVYLQCDHWPSIPNEIQYDSDVQSTCCVNCKYKTLLPLMIEYSTSFYFASAVTIEIEITKDLRNSVFDTKETHIFHSYQTIKSKDRSIQWTI